MEEQICHERHDKIKEKFDEYGLRLNKHSEEIHELQQLVAMRNQEATSMCNSIDRLNKRIDKIIEQNRNLLVTVITILAGFIFAIIQKGLLK